MVHILSGLKLSMKPTALKRQISSNVQKLSIDVSRSELMPATASALFMHGILGSKKNWRTFSHEFVKLNGQFTTIAVDHRGHGSSPALHHTPNTVASCADDIIDTIDSPDLQVPPLKIISAHSFSGKVALMYLKKRLETDGPVPEHLWVLDALPGLYDGTVDSAQRQSVAGIIRLVSSLPAEFPSKDWMVQHLVAQAIPLPIALWLCMNVVPATVANGGAGGGQFRFSFDTATIESLFADYCAQDLWGFLEEYARDREGDRTACRIHFIRAGKNHAWTPEVLGRFDELTRGGARSSVQLHAMPHVGHWLHSDDLHGTLRIMSEHSGLNAGKE